MVAESSIRKLKKGCIVAVTNIPINTTGYYIEIDFTPKTITKITIVVYLTNGASLEIFMNGYYTFEVRGEETYEFYRNTFNDDATVEINGCSFHKYRIFVNTDASTTGRIYCFLEYDYDLIK